MNAKVRGGDTDEGTVTYAVESGCDYTDWVMEQRGEEGVAAGVAKVLGGGILQMEHRNEDHFAFVATSSSSYKYMCHIDETVDVFSAIMSRTTAF